MLVGVTIVCATAAAIHAYPPLGKWLIYTATVMVTLPFLALAMSSTLIVVLGGMKALDRWDRWRNSKRPPGPLPDDP
jgi:hypothetical protein